MRRPCIEPHRLRLPEAAHQAPVTRLRPRLHVVEVIARPNSDTDQRRTFHQSMEVVGHGLAAIAALHRG